MALMGNAPYLIVVHLALTEHRVMNDKGVT